MKALTLWQPWASLIAMGEKRIETRCWTTKYRGELAIHSSANLPPDWLGQTAKTAEFVDELAEVLGIKSPEVQGRVKVLPRGSVLCIVKLLEIAEIDEEFSAAIPARERIFGNYEPGRYAWHVELVEVLRSPYPAKGNRMLWNWSGR